MISFSKFFEKHQMLKEASMAGKNTLVGRKEGVRDVDIFMTNDNLFFATYRPLKPGYVNELPQFRDVGQRLIVPVCHPYAIQVGWAPRDPSDQINKLLPTQEQRDNLKNKLNDLAAGTIKTSFKNAAINTFITSMNNTKSKFYFSRYSNILGETVNEPIFVIIGQGSERLDQNHVEIDKKIKLVKDFVENNYSGGNTTVVWNSGLSMFVVRTTVTQENILTGNYSEQIDLYNKLYSQNLFPMCGYFLAVSSNIYKLPNVSYMDMLSLIKRSFINREDVTKMPQVNLGDEIFSKKIPVSGYEKSFFDLSVHKTEKVDKEDFIFVKEEMDDTSIKPNPKPSSVSKKPIDSDTDTVHESAEVIVPDFNVQTEEFSKKFNNFYSKFSIIKGRAKSIFERALRFELAMKNVNDCLRSNKCDVNIDIDLSSVDRFKDVIEKLNQNMKEIEMSLKELENVKNYLDEKIKSKIV